MSDELFDIEHLHTPPKFLADENVRGLARWLRFLGYDTVIAQGSDEVVRLQTQRSGRCLITRDSELASLLRRHAIFVKSDVVEDQLKFVLKHVPAGSRGDLHSRCVECNEVLQKLNEQTLQCPTCHHSYRHSSNADSLQVFGLRR